MHRKTPPSLPSSPRCVPAAERVLALRPHPAVAWLCLGAMLPPGISVLVLATRGQWWTALAGALVAAGLARSLWQGMAGQGERPSRLRLARDGGLSLEFASQASEPVQPASGSLWLGRGVLLVLRGRRCHRLWLGPANLDPDALAALRRHLQCCARASSGDDRARTDAKQGLR